MNSAFAHQDMRMKALVYPDVRASMKNKYGRSNMHKNNQGFSLIELIITIVVLSIALSALTSSLFKGVGRNADPLWQTKASQLSQAYLDEILSMRFAESSPLGGGSIGSCSIDGTEIGEAGVTGRSLYDDVDDYHDLTETADFLDTTVSSYSGYTVGIKVSCIEQGNPTLTNSKLIVLTITSPTQQSLKFSVIRSDL
jgi:MSHA pilin protein MshD